MAKTKTVSIELQNLRKKYVQAVGKQPPRNHYGSNVEWLQNRIQQAQETSSETTDRQDKQHTDDEAVEHSENNGDARSSNVEDDVEESDDDESNNSDGDEESKSSSSDNDINDDNTENKEVDSDTRAVGKQGNFSFLSLLSKSSDKGSVSDRWKVNSAKPGSKTSTSFTLKAQTNSEALFQMERTKRTSGRKAQLTQEVRDDMVQDSVSKIGRGKGEKKDQATRMKKNWHGMEAPVMTEELKQTLRALQLRSYMDPKRFYKAADSKRPPKYFQIGTVVEGVGEFKTSRLKRKERKQTFVDEILGDENVRRYAKRVFNQVQEVKQMSGKGRNKNKGKGKRRRR